MKSAGKPSSKRLLVLERVVVLGERHRARVEPHVDHLGHAAHRLPAGSPPRPRAGRGSSSSSTNGRWWSASSRPERSASSAKEPITCTWPARAAPHGQRRSPVALARERPVDVVLQPLAEAPLLDVRRIPGDRLVRRPAARRAASRWRCTTTVSRSRAAACRSASSGGRRARSPRTLQQQPPLVEILDQLLGERGVLDEAPLERAARRGRARARRRCRRGSTGL